MGRPIYKGPIAPGALVDSLKPTTARNFPRFDVADFGGRSGGYTFTPAESATILPLSSVWISQQGVTESGTVSSWASYLGGRSNTLSQGTGAARPAYNATGGVGSRPLITFDGSDDVLEGSFSKGSSWTDFEGGVVGSRVAFASASDAWIMMHQGGGFIGGLRDQSASAAHFTTSTTTANGTTDPDGNVAYWHGSAITAEVVMRRNGVDEGVNLTGVYGGHADTCTVAVGGRVATGAYANIAIQAAVWGPRLTPAQRLYLRQLLTFWTGVTC